MLKNGLDAEVASTGPAVSPEQNVTPIDLSTVKPGPAEGPVKGSPSSIGGTTTLDGTRKVIAYVLLGTLIVVIVFYAAASAMFAHHCLSGTVDSCAVAEKGIALVTGTMGVVFTAMIGLVGSVIGFYFGSQKAAG